MQYKSVLLYVALKIVSWFPKKEISILLKLLFAQFRLVKLTKASIPTVFDIKQN